MPKSIYLSNKLLDLVWSATAWSPPATMYPAAMTVAPTPSGGGSEVTTGGFVRLAITNNSSNYPAATSGQKSNGTIMDWGTASAGVGTIVAIAFYDASSGGNLIGYGLLATPISVAAGQPFSVPAGGAIFTET